MAFLKQLRSKAPAGRTQNLHVPTSGITLEGRSWHPWLHEGAMPQHLVLSAVALQLGDTMASRVTAGAAASPNVALRLKLAADAFPHRTFRVVLHDKTAEWMCLGTARARPFQPSPTQGAAEAGSAELLQSDLAVLTARDDARSSSASVAFPSEHPDSPQTQVNGKRARIRASIHPSI